MRFGALASHEGTTLQAVLDACADGRISATVSVVIGNNAGSGALRRAGAAGVATRHLSSVTHAEPEALDAAIRDALREHGVELVLLLGYMKKLGSLTLAEYRGRVLNTHPALLPAFGGQGMYGLHVHRAVLAAGERETGVSIHFVDADYDSGAVLAQTRVPVAPGDTPESLAARVQERERAFLVETLADIAAGRRSLPERG